MIETLEWKVHTWGLFKEIAINPQGEAVRIPLNILMDLLKQVAKRCTEINDPKLNELMIRLSLYSISNPQDPEFNPELVSKILGENK